MPRLRLLPTTIFVACLMLTVKVTHLWEGLSRLGTSVQVAESLAQATNETPPPAAAPAEAAKAPMAEGKPAGAMGGKAKNEEPLDPILFTKSEIELLQDLSERRKEIEARRSELQQLEIVLKATEKRIDTKIADLETIKKEIEGLVTKYNEQEEAEIQRTVKTYETMKPKDAARIFNQLDLGQLLDIFSRMKESKMAAILANMEPLRAKEVTARMLERREMPNLGGTMAKQ